MDIPTQPAPKQSFILPVFLSILTFVLLLSTIYLAYRNIQLQKQLFVLQNPPNSPSAPISPTPDPTADWKTYTNRKYGYSLKHPNDYLVGYADVRSGTFNKSSGNEDQVDFLPSGSDEFNNFLQIQVSDIKSFNKTLSELVDGIYQQQKSHFQTTDISSIEKSKFGSYDDYEYTFSGQAFYTFSWDGTVKSGKYKAIIFQKDGNIYSFYLKDSDIFNQILSTFTFLEQNTLVSPNENILLTIVNRPGGDLTPKKIQFDYQRASTDTISLIEDKDIANTQKGFVVKRNGATVTIIPEFEGFPMAHTSNQVTEMVNTSLNAGKIYRTPTESAPNNYTYSTFYKAGSSCGDVKPNTVACSATNIETDRDVGLSITCSANVQDVNLCDEIVKTLSFKWE